MADNNGVQEPSKPDLEVEALGTVSDHAPHAPGASDTAPDASDTAPDHTPGDNAPGDDPDAKTLQSIDGHLEDRDEPASPLLSSSTVSSSLLSGEPSAADKQRAKQLKKDAKRDAKRDAKKAKKRAERLGPSASPTAIQEDEVARRNKQQVVFQERVRTMMNRLAIQEALVGSGSANPLQRDKPVGEHKFWSTQPVPQLGEKVEADGAIEPNTPHDQIRKEPYLLPKDFEWSTLDRNNESELNELYTLLTNNYVEDDDAMFRFDYSDKFLKWALQPPGWKKVWHCGVRVTSSKKLVAFISGIPADIRIYSSSQHLVEINFLCIHKKLRSKRLAPVLIKEITRRSNLEGIFQAVYTAGVVLPRPISEARYYHRNLNPKKLIETNFSRLPPNMTMSRVIKKFKLPGETATPGLRKMKSKDVPAVRKLLNDYMSKLNFVTEFKTDEDVRHWILPKEGVVWSYVVEDPATKTVTDFVSYYSLPSTVIGHQTHKTINAVYLFYYAVKETEEKAVKGRLQSLIKDALIMAKLQNVDVFNCLDIMENQLFLEDLKFGPGDGHLNYYMYNWRCRETKSEKVGVVML